MYVEGNQHVPSGYSIWGPWRMECNPKIKMCSRVTGNMWGDMHRGKNEIGLCWELCQGRGQWNFSLCSHLRISNGIALILRSAVGMTHSLRSDLWWTIPFQVLLGHFGIPIGSLAIKSALARHTGVRRVFGSRQSDHVITFGQSQSLLRNPTGVHGLCFGYFVSGPLLNVPWYTVHFRGSFSGSP